MKVLITTDASPLGGAAVRAASKRHWPPGTHFRLVTVVSPMPVFATTPETQIEAGKFFASARKSIERATAITAGNLKRRGRKVSYVVREGAIADEITDEARRWGANLIMVGTHARKPISRFLLGSVAQRVALTAPCSVELVRERQIANGNGGAP